MSQRTATTTIEESMSFPSKGDIVSGVKVLSAECTLEETTFTYRVCFEKGTRRADVPNILREFYNTVMVTVNEVDCVVQDHNYQIRPTRSQTIVSGSATIIPISKTNPVQKQLTALEDFDQEYTKMEMAQPETYFRVFPYRGFDGPAFRTKLFSLVSQMGENYGYCDDKKLYHRRASLVMPKIKITKAPPNAKMFYHTHPKKDEPSLSSADDYLVYFDMSHKPLNIRHFYTVMADRMDYFHVVPKHSKKKDYVKINEEKFLEEVDNQIDEAGKRLDEKLPNDTYEDNLYYCERVTREVVKFLNKKYGKYFTITYKCHYKVKRNPDKPTGSDLHLDDEFLAKGLNDIKSGKYSWPEFNSKTKPHEEYAYWHSRYFSLNRDAKGLGYIGLMPGDSRRLEAFMFDSYRGSNYSYDDILGILAISYDIRMRDSKIRDGKRNDSRIHDILDFLEITDQVVREDIMMLDSILAVDPYGDLAQEMGQHQFVLPLADFSIKSVEAMNDVKKGKKDLEMAKYEINVRLKEKMAKTVAKSLGHLNNNLGKDIRDEEGEIIDPARTRPVYGMDGVVEKSIVNPPIQIKKVDYRSSLPVEIFDNPDLIKEILDEFKKEGKDVLTIKNQYNIAIPVEDTAVSMKITISSGSVEFFYPSVGYERTIPDEEAVVSAFRKLVERLNSRGFNIPTDDIAIGTSEPMRNPNDGMIIAIVGPVQASKDKVIQSLEKRLDADVVRTYTTKNLKEYQKKSNLVETTDEIFSKMANNGDLIVVTNALDGSKRGLLRKDFLDSRYMIVDARMADMPFLLKADPSVMSFYLQPTNSEAEIKKFVMDYASPQEAEKVANLATDPNSDAEGEVDYVMSYDVEKPGQMMEEVFQYIPKKNPKPDGSVFFPGNGSNYYLTARTIPITALQGEPYANPSHHGCPIVTQDLEMNTRNRNSAIQADYIQYGPLNLEDEEYWEKAAKHWKTTVDVAKKSKCANCVAFDISPRMLECMPGSVQEDGQLGMCWMHNFKCHSARSCFTWAAGGPITEDSVSYDWQERSSKPKENPPIESNYYPMTVPRKLYHGTTMKNANQILKEGLLPKYAHLAGKGVYTTSDIKTAVKYARDRSGKPVFGKKGFGYNMDDIPIILEIDVAKLMKEKDPLVTFVPTRKDGKEFDTFVVREVVPPAYISRVIDEESGKWQKPSLDNPRKKIQVRIQESTNPEKKLMAIFTKPNGRTKTTHFGARGMSDYTQHKDKDRMKNYLARHGKMGENWDDPTTAGALSRWILWGKPSLRESFNDFKKRFNLEGVMAVTNTKMNPSKTPEGRKIPKKYLKGLNKEEMAIAAKEIDKGYKYDIDDPEAYEYWKSDIKATARGYKTVPSKYKKKFIEMYGPLPEEGEFLDKMAKATKIKKSILEKVYDKGLAAWRGGHRPGVQQHQWAAGRVYSFVTLGNTVKKGNKKMPDYSLAVEAGLIKKNPSKYREAAGAIVMDGDRILLLRRSTKETSKHGLWEFPGGKLEEDETAEQAAIIETQEESGLDVVVKGKAGEHIDHRKEKVYHAFFVEPTNVNQEVKLSEEHDQSLWVTIDEALAMEESKLSHHARHFLERMVRNNPSWRHGEFAEDDPFEDEFE